VYENRSHSGAGILPASVAAVSAAGIRPHGEGRMPSRRAGGTPTPRFHTRFYRFLLVGLLAAVSAGCELAMPKGRAFDFYARGQDLADAGELDAAIEELTRAVEADPLLSVAHLAIGDIHRTRGNWNLARGAYESACDANPYAFRPHYNLGVTYQRLAEAAAAFNRMRELLRKAVHVYLRATVLQPDDFDANLNLSACYFQLGKYELAERYCRIAIRVQPSSPHAYSNLGIIYDSQDRIDEAIRAYLTSLEFDTHQGRVLMNLGSSYMRQGRMKSALNTFTLAAEEMPDDAAPWEQIGTCRFHQREYDNALQAYRRAIELDGYCPGALRGMGVVYMTQYLLSRNAELRDKALAMWQASLEIQPHQPDLEQLLRKYSPTVTGPGM